MTHKNRKQSRALTAKRVFCIVLAVMVALSLLSMMASVIVFRAVFQRRDGGPYELKMAYSDSDAAKHPRQSVEFRSGDRTLRGNIYGMDNHSGIIILVNGFHATTDNHLAEAFFFADAGWTVFTFDGTGTGRSDGTSVIGLEQSGKDVRAAIDYISGDAQLSDRPIFLYGHSAGGYAVSTLCDDDRVRATVCISGFNSPCEIMEHFSRKYVGFLAEVSYPFLLAYDKLLFGASGNVSAREHILSADRPVLIVQGTDDEIVPLELSIYTACRSDRSSNIELALISDEYRNRHSTIWLTADAAKELAQLQSHVESIETDGISEEEEEQLAENAALSDEIFRRVDTEFLEYVSAFFTRALTR